MLFRSKDKTHNLGLKLNRLGLPFTMYDLRHLYAWHTIVAGLDPRLAARFMGHSLGIHADKYNAWLTATEYRQLRKGQLVEAPSIGLKD